MKRAWSRRTFPVVAAIALLTGCSGASAVFPAASPPQPALGSGRIAHSPPRYRRLFSFGGPSGQCLDGAWPNGRLIASNGLLYGTTYAGGTYGGGTIFSVTPDGAEQVFFNFEGSGRYGGNPLGGVTAVNGKLFGTTPGGGAYGGGVAYKIRTNSPIPIERILHGFGNGNDGNDPEAGLAAVNDKLYGTTNAGGAYGGGTVFVVNAKTGNERVLHSFGNGSDGMNPQAPLLAYDGKLYGTTNAGGTYGAGTVFSIDAKTGAERVLHAFAGMPDGLNPQAGLVAFNGRLYGTTTQGGGYGSYGSGTVFSLSLDGKNVRVLHSFGNGSDGRDPQSAPIVVNGALYGTTAQGGLYTGSFGYGGTLYRIALSDGKERVLHNFGNGSDGAYPWASPVDVNGTLYGTTLFGGNYFSVCVDSAGQTVGTVFAWRL